MPTTTLEARLSRAVAALQLAHPLLIRLGDFIGNDEARCDAVLAVATALQAEAGFADQASSTPPYKAAFPDFDFEIPPVVTGDWDFEDRSSRADVCPRFVCDVFALRIDYADPTRRVDPGPQFAITCQSEPMLDSDDWEDVRAFVEDGKRDFPRPLWSIGQRLEYENGHEAIVVAIDADDPGYAVVKKGERFEPAWRDAASANEGAWCNPCEEEASFATLEQAVTAMKVARQRAKEA